jgi:hypothetical protein
MKDLMLKTHTGKRFSTENLRVRRVRERDMSTPRLIEKRFLWTSVLTAVVVGITIYTNFIVGEPETNLVWRPLAITGLMFGGGFYSLLSLVNVAYCLVSKGGIHDDVIGFLGGLVFGFGATGLTFVTIGEVQIRGLVVVTVVLLIGLTMMVKG